MLGSRVPDWGHRAGVRASTSHHGRRKQSGRRTPSPTLPLIEKSLPLPCACPDVPPPPSRQVLKVNREHYLRKDIWAGYVKTDAGIDPPILPGEILIPDTNIVLHQVHSLALGVRGSDGRCDRCGHACPMVATTPGQPDRPAPSHRAGTASLRGCAVRPGRGSGNLCP